MHAIKRITANYATLFSLAPKSWKSLFFFQSFWFRYANCCPVGFYLLHSNFETFFRGVKITTFRENGVQLRVGRFFLAQYLHIAKIYRNGHKTSQNGEIWVCMPTKLSRNIQNGKKYTNIFLSKAIIQNIHKWWQPCHQFIGPFYNTGLKTRVSALM
jgi:hypothetical protein